MATAQIPKRPLTVSLIACFQGALALYCFSFATFALFNPARNLGYLRSALLLLIGQTEYHSYAESPQDDLIVALVFLAAVAICVGLYSARTALGLWRLQKWARHSVVGQYGVMLVLWARSFLFFGIFGGFAHVPASRLQPVYMVVTVEALICATLLYHGGIAEAFHEEE